MLSHVFSVATLTKGAVAISLVAGAVGVGSVDRPTNRPDAVTARVEVQQESERSAVLADELRMMKKLARPEKVEKTLEEPKKNEETKKPEERKPEEPKPVKTEPKKTEPAKPAKTEPKKTEPKKDYSTTFEALLKECAALYVKSAEGAAAVCERAIKASGLDADTFWAKYHYKFVVPTPKPVKTEPVKTVKSPKPEATPKPAATQKPAYTDLLQKCKSTYELVKAMKSGPAYEVAMRAFNEKCRQVLEAVGR